MSFPKFVSIAACDPKGIIGNKGKLPWHYPEDLAHFRRTTAGSVIVMGYRTFCSLSNHALQNRTCLVFTKNHSIDSSVASSIKSLEDLEEYYHLHQELLEKPNFLIGGATLFELFFAQKLIDQALITHIYKEYEGDATFPLQSIADWQKQPLYVGEHFKIILHVYGN